MLNRVVPSLVTLPVEIIYRILDHQDELTIIWSMLNVCQRLNKIVNSYHRYQVNFFFYFKCLIFIQFRGVSKDWGIGILSQFSHSSMNAKIKTMQCPLNFLLLHSSSWRNLWTWMCDYENYFRESIALTFVNDGTMREPIVNSHFPLGIIAMTLTVPLQIRNSYFSVLGHCWYNLFMLQLVQPFLFVYLVFWWLLF